MPLYKEAPTNPKERSINMPNNKAKKPVYGFVEGLTMWASIANPNTKFEPVYSVNLVVSEEKAKEFTDRGFGSSVVKHKPVSWGDESEQPTLIIKRKVQGPGFTREAPKLISNERDEDTGNWKPLNCNVGNGSRVRVKYREWTSKDGENKGLELIAVQVLDLVEYETDDEDF